MTTTFGIPDDDLSALNVSGRQTKDLPDPHPAPCHELQDEAISMVACSEDNLIHCLFPKILPLDGLRIFENLPQYGRITRVLEPLIHRIYYEIEEGTKERITESFGGLL